MATTVIKAIKGNKSYTVNNEQERKTYKAQGFDIYENDKLVENGIGKTVTLEAYNALKDENDKLKKKNAKLDKELKELKGGTATPDANNTKD